ncbi:hypothetical protein N8633_02425 [bacterium]|jgi:hypothetical protein|nr:hypothetical protein [bacterium]
MDKIRTGNQWRRSGRIIAWFCVVSICTIAIWSRAQNAILDETWSVSVAGQTVQVDPDGSFLIPNISAPDQFGAQGPGSRPDFLSDNFVRLIGFNTRDGVTQYVYSPPFQLTSGETFVIEELILTFSPPPFPESIKAQATIPTLTEVGQTTQVIVSGTLIDDSVIDVSSADRGTSYRTSNPEIIQVDADGQVIGLSKGTGFITAINEGATTVTRIDVSPGDELTTVAGVVLSSDGQPISDATIQIIGAAGTTTSRADGSFTIEGVGTASPVAGILIRTEGANASLGLSTQIELVPGGFTDAGIITPISCEDLNVTDCLDSDGDCLPDEIERQIGLNPNLADTNNNGITDGEEDQDGDGLSNCFELLSRTNLRNRDTDRDGLTDGEEVLQHQTNPTVADTDGDGLIDPDEINRMTNPLRIDSDGDGWTDEAEAITESDPLDFKQTPRLYVTSSLVTTAINGFTSATSIQPGVIISRPIVRVVVPGFSGLADENLPTIVARPPVTVIVPNLNGKESESAPLIIAQPPLKVGFESP